MKTLKYLFFTVLAFLMAPSLSFAAGGGSGVFGDIDAVDIINDLTGFLTGPILVAIGTLLLVVGGFAVMKSKANDNRAWEWMGRICIGLLVATAAGGIVSTLFAGATL